MTRITQHGYNFETLREVFDEVDEDGSGEIEFDEFQKLIQAFHLGMSLPKQRMLFKYFDSEGNGAISYTDFAATLYPDHAHEFDTTNFKMSRTFDHEGELDEEGE